MLQNLTKTQKKQSAQVVTINGEMTQFELINAIYDSKILSTNKLTTSSRLVLIALARHYNPANEDFFPSYACIVEHTGVSKKSVERAIKELVEKGLITYRTKKVNRYRFTGHFFAQLKMSPNVRQIDDLNQRQNDDQTNKKEKINKKGFLNNFLNRLNSQNHESAKPQPCGNSENHQTEVKTQQNQENLSPAPAKNFAQPAVIPFAETLYTAQDMQNITAPSFRGGYYKRKNGYQYEKAFAVVNSHVPSVAETSSYLQDLRSARKEACAPIDFDKAKAIAWYNSLSPVLKKSNMAKKVAEKFSLSA